MGLSCLIGTLLVYALDPHPEAVVVRSHLHWPLLVGTFQTAASLLLEASVARQNPFIAAGCQALQAVVVFLCVLASCGWQQQQHTNKAVMSGMAIIVISSLLLAATRFGSDSAALPSHSSDRWARDAAVQLLSSGSSSSADRGGGGGGGQGGRGGGGRRTPEDRQGGGGRGGRNHPVPLEQVPPEFRASQSSRPAAAVGDVHRAAAWEESDGYGYVDEEEEEEEED
eukprot:GHVU01055712.1.p3 GENE.GHVU01055712.1~~GHVU01055712.1.p3  ORF type:complete len:226 (+),score=67.82 GHVU01055712.1:1375-2052(+)